MKELIAYCESESGALRRDIETLVRLESPSDDKAAVDRCGDLLVSMLEAAGARVSRLRQETRGDHVRAEFAGGPRRVLILGHFDTVWPLRQIDRMPIREEDGRLHGPGVYDMKASIAIALLAVRALEVHRHPRPRIVMLWTTDEEVGSATSRDVIEREARESDAVLVVEPSLPGGACKTQRKGCGEFHLKVHGIAAHAGIDPRQGASAVHELARLILAVEKLADPDRGVTVNAGIISGGTRPNVVAETAEAVVDVRAPTMADADRLNEQFRNLQPVDPRVRLEITGGFERPPLERTPGVARLYLQAREIARAFGRDLAEGGTGGGSDGNFTAALGVPTLDGLGPDGGGAHALHEHVLLADLPWRAALMAGLLEGINRGAE
ncbi:MAG TPA: M20 family metallopeptidase [Vicinamibacterales bacterium]|nr:M20 family metallopeptidase [Vicinamibacterales bacterium]